MKEIKVIALNGSPRKNWNTAKALESALAGAEAAGAQTELIHLYDYDYSGCRSCFACKLIDGPSYGNCALKDSLTPILEKVREADVLIMGSPIYAWDVTGAMRSCLERIIFPCAVYDDARSSLWPKNTYPMIIYTMNVLLEDMPALKASLHQSMEVNMPRIFRHTAEVYHIEDTKQFGDYSKYYAPRWNAELKEKRLQEVFPKDCEKIYEMAYQLTEKAMQD